MGEQNNFTRRMFIKGIATSFGALPVFAWPRWAQAFYYNLGFFKKNQSSSLYVEDVFSTYLYTGDNNSRTIANGIDLAGKGGLVWIKMRSASSSIHCIYDSARGFATDKTLDSSASNGQFNMTPSGLSGALANGFNIGSHTYVNTTAMHGGTAGPQTYTSWTFRKAAKFFDVVTYTGDGTGMKTINHSLGVTPGMVIIKRVDGASDWVVWHRSLTLTGNTQGLKLNTTDAFGTPTGGGVVWYTTAPMTSTTMSVGSSQAGEWNTNLSGASYVAYLFAHDAATDGVIQCGSYTGSGGVDSVTLGWEPQFVLMKSTSAGTQWSIEDVMRDMNHSAQKQLQPNSSGAELAQSAYVIPNATGFTVNAGYYGTGATVIYVAIRRPMKTPTLGTQVFNAVSYTGDAANPKDRPGIGFSPDLLINMNRGAVGDVPIFLDRLRGPDIYLDASGTVAASVGAGFSFLQDGFRTTSIRNASANNYISWAFRRAPGFFDQVCYSGNDVASRTVTHGLKVVPELMIVKSRGTGNWYVWYSPDGTAILNSSAAGTAGDRSVFGAAPTSSVFTCDNASVFDINASGVNYVAYLFASCPGVSKIGSYTGSGSSQTINCGFTSTARFILIKRTDATGDWYVWDTARGIGTVSSSVEQLYTTPGTYTWTVPAGVTSVSVVCVGGGAGGRHGSYGSQRGGGGGELRYRNNISVTPGASITVVVGAGGSGTSGESGGVSTFNSTTVVANGGSGITGGSGGVGDGGANGGNGGDSVSSSSGGGGGGAGGYTGIGGNGGAAGVGNAGGSGTGGAGGGGGGGGWSGPMFDNNNWYYGGSGGGGVGLYGAGSNGAGGNGATYSSNSYSWGGVGGGGSAGSSGITPQNVGNGNGGSYGAGGGGGGYISFAGTYFNGGNGGGGAVRIIWGAGKSFPSAAGSSDPRLSLNTTAAEVSTDNSNSVDTATSGFIVNQVTATNINVNGATYIFMAIA